MYKRQVLNTKVYDEVITIENEDAFTEGRAFAVSEGILVGISSGAALKAATILACLLYTSRFATDAVLFKEVENK